MTDDIAATTAAALVALAARADDDALEALAAANVVSPADVALVLALSDLAAHHLHLTAAFLGDTIGTALDGMAGLVAEVLASREGIV